MNDNIIEKKENKIDDLLRFMIESKASDLHLSAGLEPSLRVDGEIRKIIMEQGDNENNCLDNDSLTKLIYEMMTDEQIEELKETREADFSYALVGVGRFRVNVFYQNRGITTVLRAIPEKIWSMEDLGMDSNEVFKKLANSPRGLVLVTGPTGSGKSTTLAAMIDYINKNKKEHILTIEDPIEFVHESKKSIVNQREVHRDTLSFNNALRSALREDPDVILVGEMRDLETIKLALTAAETGHVVFGTLHTNSATKTIDRIIDVFPAAEKPMIRAMLSESLVGVISQALLKKEGGGRIAAHEIMVATTAIRNLIREGKIAQMQSTLQTGAKDGMITMDQSLTALVASGKITKQSAYEKAFDKSKFE